MRRSEDRPGHVLLTADAVGGVWSYVLELGEGLVRSGLRVTLAVMGPDAGDAQRARARVTGLQLVDLGGTLDWTASDEAEVAAAARTLASLASTLKPDLIHLNSPALAAFGPLGAPVLAACHSCLKTWWTTVKGDEPLPCDLAWRVALTARGYAAADALLAPSHTFAQATQAAYGLKVSPHVIWNGLNLADPITPAGVAPPRTSEPRVLTAGRLWDHGKDVATLDRAADRLGFRIEAAGPVTSPTGATLAFSSLDALGPLDPAALAARMAERPIFVSTSLYEPFGLAVLEAAQAGCALVLSDIETFRELWDGAADFFPPGDDHTLADQLTRLANDPARRRAQGEAAHVRSARYTADAMTQATLHLYAQLSPAAATAWEVVTA